MAAGAGGRRGSKAGIGDGESRRRAEANRKIGEESVQRVRSRSCGRRRGRSDRGSMGNASGGRDGRRARRRRRRGNRRGTFQRIVRMKGRAVIGGRPGSAVSKI